MHPDSHWSKPAPLRPVDEFPKPQEMLGPTVAQHHPLADGARHTRRRDELPGMEIHVEKIAVSNGEGCARLRITYPQEPEPQPAERKTKHRRNGYWHHEDAVRGMHPPRGAEMIV